MGCIYFESFEWFCLQINSDTQYFFLSCSRHCDWGLIVVIEYYFQIWNKKEHNIIISRVISSHMGPMYIETPYINTFAVCSELTEHNAACGWLDYFTTGLLHSYPWPLCNWITEEHFLLFLYLHGILLFT